MVDRFCLGLQARSPDLSYLGAPEQVSTASIQQIQTPCCLHLLPKTDPNEDRAVITAFLTRNTPHHLAVPKQPENFYAPPVPAHRPLQHTVSAIQCTRGRIGLRRLISSPRVERVKDIYTNHTSWRLPFKLGSAPIISTSMLVAEGVPPLGWNSLDSAYVRQRPLFVENTGAGSPMTVHRASFSRTPPPPENN